MGSFLNLSSHTKDALKEGQKVAFVLAVLEVKKINGLFVSSSLSPITYFDGFSEDYGYVEFNKNEENTLFETINEYCNRFIDAGSKDYVSSFSFDDIKMYPKINKNAPDRADDANIQDILLSSNQYRNINCITEKMQNGLVIKGDNSDHFYILKSVLFKNTVFNKAKKVPLITNYGDVLIEDYIKQEIEEVFNNVSAKYEKYSKDWYLNFYRQMAHPLYVNIVDVKPLSNKDSIFKKEAYRYYEKFLELKYLKNLGLVFTQVNYAGQDYSNDLGKNFKEVKKKVLK